jgi:FkbM family methyltransferase
MRHPSKPDSLGKIRTLGMPIGTVLDVGVLTGTPELIWTFPDIPHLLFEPVTEWNDRIANRYREIKHEIINVAVSDKDGTATLELTSVNPIYKITHTQVVEQARPDRESRQVPMATLDTLLRDRHAEGPYLLKIDVDGHELPVLAGACETLEKTSVVVIEAHISSLMERAKALEAAGFELFDIVDLAYYDDRLWQVDLVFLNKRMMLERKLGLNQIENYDFANKYQVYTPPAA